MVSWKHPGVQPCGEALRRNGNCLHCRIVGLLALQVILFLPDCVAPISVSVLYDSVQVELEPHGAHIVQSAESADDVTVTKVDALAEWASTLPYYDATILPALSGYIESPLNDDEAAVAKGWVEAGGTLVTASHEQGDNHVFLNRIFGLNTRQRYWRAGDWPLQEGAAGGCFDAANGSPPYANDLSLVIYTDLRRVPEEGVVLYSDGGLYRQVSAWYVDVGAGRIYVLGYDWESGPEESWDWILSTALRCKGENPGRVDGDSGGPGAGGATSIIPSTTTPAGTPLEDGGLQTTAVMTTPPASAVFGVVGGVALSGLSTEQFNITQQDTLIAALASMIQVPLRDIEITGLLDSGFPEYPLFSQFLVAEGPEGINRTLELVQEAFQTRDLSAELRARSLNLQARFMYAEVCGYLVPRVAPQGVRSSTSPHVLIDLTVSPEAVRSFQHSKQRALADAMADLLGVDGADMAVVGLEVRFLGTRRLTVTVKWSPLQWMPEVIPPVSLLLDEVLLDIVEEGPAMHVSIQNTSGIPVVPYWTLQSWIDNLPEHMSAVLPEMDSYTVFPLEPAQAAEIRKWVEEGGSLVTCSDDGGDNHDFLNDVFGWELKQRVYRRQETYPRAPGAAGTCFDERFGSPDVIMEVPVLVFTDQRTLPEGALALYWDAGLYRQVSVWSQDVGRGRVYQLAYDWGSGGQWEWDWVLRVALTCKGFEEVQESSSVGVVLDKISVVQGPQALEPYGLPFDATLEGVLDSAIGVVASIAMDAWSIGSFNTSIQERFRTVFVDALKVDDTAVDFTGLEDSGKADYPLVVQVVIAPKRAAVNLTELYTSLGAFVQSRRLQSRLAAQKVIVGTRLDSLAMATRGLPEVIVGDTFISPYVSTEVVVEKMTVETFDGEKQDALRAATAGLLQLELSSVALVSVREERLSVSSVLVELRAWAPVNTSLRQFAGNLNVTLVEPDALQDYDLPFITLVQGVSLVGPAPASTPIPRKPTAIVASIALTRFNVASFGPLQIEVLMASLASLLDLDEQLIRVTGKQTTGAEQHPLVIQVAVWPRVDGNETVLLNAVRSAVETGSLEEAMRERDMEVGLQIRREAIIDTRVSIDLPAVAEDGVPLGLPHVVSTILVEEESVKMFDREKQEALKGALGDLLGLDVGELEVLLVREPKIESGRVAVQVRGVPSVTGSSNVSVSDRIGNLSSIGPDAMAGYGLPFRAVVEDLELATPLWQFAWIYLDHLDVESFAGATQNAIMTLLSERIGPEPSHLDLIGVASSGHEQYPLVLLVASWQQYGENTTAMAGLQQNVLMSFTLENTNVTLGARVGKSESLDTDTSLETPEVVEGFGDGLTEPYVLARTVVEEETVEAFGSGKQAALKAALGDVLGLAVEDLEVVLMKERRVGAEALEVVVRGIPTTLEIPLEELMWNVSSIGAHVLEVYELPFEAVVEGVEVVVPDVVPPECPRRFGNEAESSWCTWSAGSGGLCGAVPQPLTHKREGYTAVGIGNAFVVVFGGAVEVGGRPYSVEDNNVFVLDLHLPRFRWIQPRIHGDGPLARAYHSSLVRDDELIVFGGQSSDGHVLADVWALHLGFWEWRNLYSGEAAPSALHRYGHATILMDSAMLVFGGRLSRGSDCRADVWSFDLDELVWSEIQTSGDGPSLCQPQALSLTGLSVVVLEAIGGPSVWRLDTATWSWTQVITQWPRMLQNYAVLHPGSSAVKVFGADCERTSQCVVWSLNLFSMTWSKSSVSDYTWGISLSDPQSDTDGFGSVSTGRRKVMVPFTLDGRDAIVVMGVSQALHDVMVVSANLEDNATSSLLYATVLSSAPTLSQQPARRHRMAAAVGARDGNLLVFGGVHMPSTGGNGNCNVRFLNDTWKLSLRTRQWSAEGGPSPQARQGHSLIDVDGTKVLFGGSSVYLPLLPTLGSLCREVTATIFNDVWTIEPGSRYWSFWQMQGQAPQGREAHVAVAFEGSMLVYGGLNLASYDGSKTSMVEYNEMWFADLNLRSWRQIELVADRTPRALSFQAAAMLGDTMLIFGGVEFLETGGILLSDELWSVAVSAPNAAWTMTAVNHTGGFGIAAHGMLAVGSRLWVFGGLQRDPSCSQLEGQECSHLPSNALVVLDTVSWTWTGASRNDAPRPRAFHATVAAGSDLLVLGGVSMSETDDGYVLQEHHDVHLWPVATQVNAAFPAVATHLSLATEFSSVLLPDAVSMGSARLTSAFVTLEPRSVSSVAVVHPSNGSTVSFTCGASYGCRDFKVLSVVFSTTSTMLQHRIFHVYGRGAGLVLRQCVFTRLRCPVQACIALVEDGATLTAQTSVFSDVRSAAFGAAVVAHDSQVSFELCAFYAMSAAGSGGSILVQRSPEGLILNTDTEFMLAQPSLSLLSCAFVLNTAGESGGAVACQEEAACSMVACAFISNSALKWSGGAVLIASDISEIRSSAFSNNEALNGGGGGIYWTNKVPTTDLLSSSCSRRSGMRVNQALYAPCIGSIPWRFTLVTEDEWASSGTGQERPVVQPSVLTVLDYYNQTISLPGGEAVTIDSFSDALPLLSGGTLANWAHTSPRVALPGLSLAVVFFADGQPVDEDVSLRVTAAVDGSRVSLLQTTTLPTCPLPQRLTRKTASLITHHSNNSLGMCVHCPAGTYRVAASCLPCPSRSPCPGTPKFLPVVGTWALAPEGQRLRQCPEGHMLVNSTAGTSKGTFSHDAQQCKQCSTATQYILDPNTDTCQECPPGLRCHGNSHIEPVVANSTWKVVGGAMHLVNCPTGYQVYNESLELQECLPCGAGAECTLERCEVCSPCRAGTFKNWVGPEACKACPKDAYRPLDLPPTGCAPCPRFSRTDAAGQTSPESCKCDSRYYMAGFSHETPCMDCPVGARCRDGSCGFAVDGSCEQEIVGSWERELTGEYRLRGCPEGHMLVNSTEGTSTGTFSPDAQQCRPCHSCLEYILNPNTDTCNKCPVGLRCMGNSSWEPQVPGSTWIVVDGVLILHECPTGYRMYNLTAGLQECQSCESGMECVSSTCHECRPCEAGTKKSSREGGTVCEKCPAGSFSPFSGQTSCTACPAGTHSEEGAARCGCDSQLYFAHGRPTSAACTHCPTGAQCADASCALSRLPPSCEGFGTIVGSWQFDDDGLYHLKDCPPGYQLLNSSSTGIFSHDEQECRHCPDGMYILHALDSACRPCPAGATCREGVFNPRVPGSVWDTHSEEPRLLQCPTGYLKVNDTIEHQRCELCDAGMQCVGDCVTCEPCPKGTYKAARSADVCQPCPAQHFGTTVGATDVGFCTPCPAGTLTHGEVGTSLDSCTCDPRLYRAQSSPTHAVCMRCPSGAVCSDSAHHCSFGIDPHCEAVGQWEPNEDGLMMLQACPDGYTLVNSTGGTSRGIFSHDIQQCKKCLAHTQYIINPNTDICKECPAGLRCHGNSHVEPVVANSTWEVVGGVMKLVSCPTGYRVYNLSVELQECQPCDAGTECTLERCETCKPCGVGKFKSSAGPQACTECPLNTYGPSMGATALAQCISCPLFSHTNAAGQTSPESCKCDSRYYMAGFSHETPCMDCPVGARCRDGSCGFAVDGSCEQEIVGSWERELTGEYRLRGCPEGHMLVNSTEGTSTGTFSPDAQQCKACSEHSAYIVYPNSDVCQRCPVGLKCFGNSTIQPLVANSTWVIEDGLMILRSCPTGYRLYNLTPDLQECQPCPAGAECTRERCTLCTLCEVGYYKDQSGTQACSECPHGTFSSIEGASSADQCQSCPPGASTLVSGQADSSACVCTNTRYSVPTNNGAVVCSKCPVGAICGDGSCALHDDDHLCSNTTVTGVWARGVDSLYRILVCPEGHMLVNSTAGTSKGTFSHDVQQCKQCLPGAEYILNPNTDTCQECPPGLRCHGNSHIEPVVANSTWKVVGGAMHLVSCPTGHQVYNESLELQECLPCGAGAECTLERCEVCSPCRAGTFKEDSLPESCKPCPKDTFGSAIGAASIRACQACPAFAFTSSVASTDVRACICSGTRYFAESAGGAQCMTCPDGGTCPDGSCARFQDSLQCSDSVPIIGSWTVNEHGHFVLLGCPDGHQLVNSTAHTSQGTYSHDVQQCKPCSASEYIMNPNKFVCTKCPPGLRCHGNSHVEPVVANSTWEVVGGVMKLVSCPTGYRVYNLSVELQECQPCDAGTECTLERCETCKPCGVGKFKSSAGPQACTECPLNTYGPSMGATALAQCLSCPEHSFTTSEGHFDVHDCVCESRFYSQWTGSEIACIKCPEGAICSDGTCGLADGAICADSMVGTWSRQSVADQYALVDCPAGHQLINPSHDAQRCHRCVAWTEYIVDPRLDECKPCPAGLDCPNADSVVHPKVDGSVWELTPAREYKLLHCPQGYRVYNLSRDLQECQPCDVGLECVSEVCFACTPCNPGHFKESQSSRPCDSCPRNHFNPEFGAISHFQCVACADNAVTASEGAVSAQECFCDDSQYQSTDLISGRTLCTACPTGAVCDDGSCAFNNPRMACNDGHAVGKWVPGEGEVMKLIGCPAGHSLVNSTTGTSYGTFSHDNQQCKPCLPDQQYVINPNTDECQTCPPGLRCQGDEVVTPVIEGSVWEVAGDVYKLKACPTGYRLYNFMDTLQECQPCGLGQQCTLLECFVCTACQAGSYKDVVGTQACTSCPLHTFGPEMGSTSLVQCTPCPPFSITPSAGQTSPSACKCDSSHYLAVEDVSNRQECLACPLGLTCRDGSCARQNTDTSFCASLPCNPSWSCMNDQTILGDWWIGDTGVYKLRSCPDGHTLVNSTDGTSQGHFAQELQRCKPCKEGSEYILRPDVDTCQKCPPGLICHGGSSVEPVLNGSVWEARGDVYKLVSCPHGHFVFNLSDASQECLPCGRGEECNTDRCVVCTPCSDGTYKDVGGLHPCLPCPINTYGPESGAISVAQCRSCPTFSVTSSDRQTTAAACLCDPEHYPAIDARTGERTCMVCPVGQLCHDGRCGLSNASTGCPDGTLTVGEWSAGVDGIFRLRSCPDGNTLVNSTEGTSQGHFAQELQRCKPCKEGSEYILRPDVDTCQKCPPGLICHGGSSVEPVLNGSVWEARGDVYKLVSCPHGHYAYNRRQTSQECLPCGLGEECTAHECTVCTPCAQGTYKDTEDAMSCRPCPLHTYGTTQGAVDKSLCTPCPANSYTQGEGSTSAASCSCDSRFYQGSAVTEAGFSCLPCPVGAVCPNGDCWFSANGSQCELDFEPVGAWLQHYDGMHHLQDCPDGHSLVNSTTGTSYGTFSHDNQQCKPCLPDQQYVINPNTDECQTCPPGLRCQGDEVVTPVIEGSVWEVAGDVYKLKACPTGYRLYNFMDTLQECQPCGRGETCNHSPCSVCSPCPAGFYKDEVSNATCQECAWNTYGPYEGAGSRSECFKCHPMAFTSGKGKTLPTDCVCSGPYYWALDELSRATCYSCPAGALCRDGTCFKNATAATCTANGPIVGTWERAGSQMYKITSCPAGHSLVNSTVGTSQGIFSHDIQQCRRCSVDDYILRPNTDECQKCPPGLVCDGTASVTPVLAGSTWLMDGAVYRLTSCPSGHRIFAPAVEFQQCTECGLGEECIQDQCTDCSPCRPGRFKNTVGAQECRKCPVDTYNPEAGATAIEQCIQCPEYSFSDSDGSSRVEDCSCASQFYLASAGGAPVCMTCPVGAVCLDGSCALQYDGVVCPGGDAIVGAWQRRPDKLWELVDCPAGYHLIDSLDGGSVGEWSHDSQHCHPCLRTEYVTDASFLCQPCPPGLVCEDGVVVGPVVAGSEWRQEGPVYLLESCPMGYRRYTLEVEFQECQACDPGTECRLSNCSVCSLCAPGHFKEARAAEQCSQCPFNTFGPAIGAASRDDCRLCPAGAVTAGPGKTSPDDCFCGAATYPIVMLDASNMPVLNCKECPVGALCGDSSCALALANFSCPATGRIPGEWVRNPDMTYSVVSCPNGHQLINSTSGTAVGTYNHGIQQCRPCKTCEVKGDFCRGAEYIVDAYKFQCQPCPLGAVCNGHILKSVNDLDTFGARWEPDNEGIYRIQSCPTGYRMENLTGVENQECQHCPEDYFIAASDNPDFQCYVCPASATCPNRGLPIWQSTTVDAQIELTGISEVDASNELAVRQLVAEALGIQPHEVEVGQTTADGEFSSNQDERRRLLSWEDNTSRPSSDSADRWLLQAGSTVQVTVRISHSMEHADSLANYLTSQNFTNDIDTAATRLNHPFAVAPATNAPKVDKNKVWSGEIYEMNYADGSPMLKKCNPGYLLVNSTINAQQCKWCNPETYSLNPYDKCEDGVCSQRECFSCPVGADCLGGPNFVPKTGDLSDWKAEYIPELDAHLYRIMRAAPGHILVRGTDPSYDQAVPCAYASYALEVAHDGGQVMFKRDAGEFLAETRHCLPCPQGAVCSGELGVRPKKNWWRGTSMFCPASACNSKGCAVGECEAPAGALGMEEMEGSDTGDLVRRRAMVYRCAAAGACLNEHAPSIDLRRDYADYFTPNQCASGHGGVLCGVCVNGFVMQLGMCGPCPENPGATPWIIVALIGFFVLVGWYFFAWRPLLKKWEDKAIAVVVEWYQQRYPPDEEDEDKETLMEKLHRVALDNISRDSIKVMIGFFQVGGSFVTTFAIDWPGQLAAILSIASSLFQFDFLSFPGLACLTSQSFDFTATLMFTTLMPCVGVALMALPSMIAFSAFKEPVIGATIEKFWHTLFFFLFATYPAASFAALKVFACKNLGADGIWLRSDLSFSCPLPSTDPFTFFWGCLSTLLIPIGIPLYIYYKLRQYRVPDLAYDKQAREAISALLLKLRKMEMKLMEFTEAFGHAPSRKAVISRIAEAMRRVGVEEGDKCTLDDLYQVMYVMGLDPSDDDLVRMINLWGQDSEIDAKGIRTAIRELCVRVKFKQELLTGTENALELSHAQLKVLCVEPWERRNNYKSAERYDIAEVLKGTAFKMSPGWLNHYNELDITDLLFKKAREMQYTGDLCVDPIRWDGVCETERRAINHLGFLFMTYKPRCWWFELFEMLRKLVIVSGLVFVWDGTGSQVAVGFFVTFACTVLSLTLQPFVDPTLGVMYSYALGVQMATILYGLLLITEQFEEITGEEHSGWVGPISVPDFLLVLNCSVFAIPVLKFAIQASNFTRQLVHVETVLRHMLPWASSAHQRTRLQRRNMLRDRVKDKVIPDLKDPAKTPEQVQAEREEELRRARAARDGAGNGSPDPPSVDSEAGEEGLQGSSFRALSAVMEGSERSSPAPSMRAPSSFMALPSFGSLPSAPAPSAAEAAVLERMRERLEQLEVHARRVVDDEQELQPSAVLSCAALVARLKEDAEALPDVMPWAAQDQLNAEALPTLEHLDHILSNLRQSTVHSAEAEPESQAAWINPTSSTEVLVST